MCCQRKPGRYLPSAAIFVSCTHSFPFAEQLALCDRVGVDKREKKSHFPNLGALVDVLPSVEGAAWPWGSLGASLGPTPAPGVSR